MVDLGTVTGFIIISFCFALVLIMKKNTLAPQMRRGLAIMALIMVSFSFFLILYNLFTMG